LIIVCGLACSHESPQTAFDHAYNAFFRGELKQSQDEANREYQRLHNSDRRWAWKFRILEAESFLWQGQYAQALTTVNSPPDGLDKDSLIEILAIEGAANARLHEFSSAEEELGQAIQMCQLSLAETCGDISRAGGVLAVERGQIDSAKEFFGQSLRFARAHNDRFLELTSLLNLSLTSLREDHFDEAIVWSKTAYQASKVSGAEGVAQGALGNLGWAYYSLGDFAKSLEISLEAEKRAREAGNTTAELYWVTNLGYAYVRLDDLTRGRQSYLTALALATKNNGKEGIYNALRALALVSIEEGKIDEARKYSDDAFAIARADNNRLNELYPLLVKGLIAARSHEGAEAEHLFRDVAQDPKVNSSLRWRSQHALAQLYEDEDRSDEADPEYRAAIATFEGARSQLKHDDSKLPFSNNASSIYDDYVHFLMARGRTDDALRWADYSRAQTLAEGLGLLAKGAFTEPPPLKPEQIARRVGGTVLFYWLGDKQSYLWAITPQKTSFFTLPPRSQIDAAVERYHTSLEGLEDVIETSDPDGCSLYRTLIEPAQALIKKDAKVFVIPDGKLNSLNFETLLASSSLPQPIDGAGSQTSVSREKVHYWIEDATISNASSLRILDASRARERKNAKNYWRSLLLMGDSISPNSKFPELPEAAAQMTSVAGHFSDAKRRILARDQATPAAYLASNPEQYSYIHFVAHGTARQQSPLDSAIVLSKNASSEEGGDNSFKLYASDIIQHHLRADLVTISACYSAGEPAYSGEGLVGLSWAFLGAGAHNVVAALWQATDVSTKQLMDKFYDELGKGVGPDAALRTAKLSLLHNSTFHNPFYWAPFQLYTGS
jgi:CHAT domain-containing protein/tetratricopeptide (TPR) repeat protein